jgi:type II secretory pathway predicted ATPase ExeA
MYETFFGFRILPFRLAPDPHFLYFSRQHKAALDHLEYALVHDVAFCLISGDVGSGKTTLVRHLLSGLSPALHVGLMSDTSRDIRHLLDWVSLAFELPVEGLSELAVRKQFKEFLEATSRSGRRAVLIVDEAQNLGPHNLEELRLLSNVNAGQDVQLQVILVGQPELRTQFRDPQLRQFAQRISIQFHLGSLSADETNEYIRHRLRVAGGSEEIFTPNAIRLVYLNTRGVPRMINRLCDHALAYGFGTGEQRIGHVAVAEATAMLGKDFG